MKYSEEEVSVRAIARALTPRFESEVRYRASDGSWREED